MKIFLISPVRVFDIVEQKEILEYVVNLEEDGADVHLPIRDTDQDCTEFDICTQNAVAIRDADEVHVWWNVASSGSKFDLGVAFALGKKVVVANDIEVSTTKSFCNLLHSMEESL